MMDYQVKQLRFAADDESGSYVEALLISIGQKENYILHQYTIDEFRVIHRKIEFSNRDDLLKAFPYAIKHSWSETDEQCGFSNIPTSEFHEAHKRRLTIQRNLERIIRD